MTTFIPVDSDGRLWQVNNLLSEEQVQHITQINWQSARTDRAQGQHFWLRKQVVWDDPVVQLPARWHDDKLAQINSAAGTDFVHAGGVFWIDYPGFDCAMHTDGHLPNSLQMYWIVPGPDYGTGFYRYRSRDSLLYQFSSVVNTGYLMLNHLNPDGSQPLLWHAMFNPVPEGFIRVSSYWQFT